MKQNVVDIKEELTNISKNMQSDNLIDLSNLVLLDSEGLITKSIEKYLKKQIPFIVNKFGEKSKHTTSIKETYHGLISISYANSEIICSFGHYTNVLGISGTVGVNLVSNTLEETREDPTKELYLNKEEILAIIGSM